MLVNSRTAQGTAAEALACRYLEAQGLVLEARNFRCREGELDLIMRAGEQLVFVEVRSRCHRRYGTPAESVTPAKQRRLLRAAAIYLQQRRIEPPCRFDVVAILRPADEPHIEWIRDAFQLS